MPAPLRPPLAALVAAGVCWLAASCGGAQQSSQQSGQRSNQQPSTQSARSPGAGGGEEAPAAGQGVLETLEPQDPARPYFHDFGELIHGDSVRWKVRFRNRGRGPLSILSAQAACGCTRLDAVSVIDRDGAAPRRARSLTADVVTTVPPGGVLEVEISVLTTFTRANQRKLALFRLTTDSDLEPYVTLELSFLPTRPFMFAPAEARLLNTPTSHGGAARVKILVDRKETLARVLGVESRPDGVEVDLVTETFGGEYVWYLDVTVPPLSPLGVTRGDVVLRTTDRDGEGEDGRLKVPVIAQVVPDVILGKPQVTLGAVPTSSGATFESQLHALVPGARLRVLEARAESPLGAAVSVETAPLEPDAGGRSATWSVRVAVAPGATPGFLSGDLVLLLDEPVGGIGPDGASTELRFRLSGQVFED